MKRGVRKSLAILMSVIMVFGTIALTPEKFQQNAWALTNEDIADMKITVENIKYTYTGSAIEPAMTVTAMGDNYSGTAVKTIYDLVNVTVDDSNLKDFEFEGKDKTPIVILTHDDKQLNINVDYEVKYENNFNPGTATIKITGIGNYKGEIVRTFKIVKKSIGNVTIRTSFDANKQLVVKVNNGSYAMTKGADYDYAVVTDATGKITITFTGLGDNYSGTCVKVIEANDNPNAPQETTTAKQETTKVSVAKTKVNKATKKKTAKKIKISLKKINGATKYQIQISKAKKFNKKSILVKKTVKKATFTINSKKIKKSKTLYVRARAIKIVNGKTYYGKWSKVKKAKISK